MASSDGYGSGSIITPEAVLLNFELAGLGSRALAYAVDFAVQLVALIGFAFIVGFVGIASPLIGLIVLLVGLILIVLGYPTAMETFYQGRTLGRMVVSTRVVTVEGAPVRFRHAFLRALLGIVDLLATAGAIAVATSLMTKRGQRLGDLVAGTMVIREPRKAAQTGALTFWPPAYLREWSSTLDTRGLGNDVYQLVRDFLTRPDFDDNEKAIVAEDLALLVSERMPHAARTPAVPAIDYLLAVASAAQGPIDAPAPPPPGTRRDGVLPPPVVGLGARPAGLPPAPAAPTGVPRAPGPPAGLPPVVQPARTGLPPGVPAAPAPPMVSPAPAPPPAGAPPGSGQSTDPDDGGFAAPG